MNRVLIMLSHLQKCAICVIFLVNLSACSDTDVEKKTTRPVLQDPPHVDIQRNGDGIWLLPRKIVTSGEPSKEVLRMPANVLLKVEIEIYPKIDCDAPDNRLLGTSREYLEPMTQEELAVYGKPISVSQIWMVPALTHDERGEFWYEEPSYGPLWLGNALRLVSVGQSIFFDASQNCDADFEGAPSKLPTNIFRSALAGYPLRINARSPFTAKIVEVCPEVSIVIKEERREMPGFIGYIKNKNYPRINRTSTVSAQCPSGEHIFTLAY